MTVVQRPTANQLQVEQLPWATFENPWGKSEMKLLRCSIVKESYTVIVRWPAGIVVPRHRHFGDVHVYTFNGSWHYKEYDWSANAAGTLFGVSDLSPGLLYVDLTVDPGIASDLDAIRA